MKSILRLKRHETFSIREGWLEKGINILPDNPKSLNKENGPLNYGLGSNMCKSLRYWLEACGIAKFSQGEAFLTPFGEKLRTVDPYLESDFSWWMIHCNLAMNADDAPVINAFFNLQINRMDKDYIFRNLKEKFETEYESVGADSSLDSDISVLLKSYYSDDVSNPENNMNCPFGKLGLIGVIDKKTYVKTAPSFSSLSFKVIYWCIINCLNDTFKSSNGGYAFNVEDLCLLNNNPINIFNISKSTLFLYLEEMKKVGYINLVKTAGLNTVYIDKILGLDDLF